jgi:two-component system OmpR family sensor kinase
VSLRARLLGGIVILVAAGLAAAAVVTYEEQRSFLYTRVHQQVLSALAPMSVALQLDRRRGGRRWPQFRRFSGRPFGADRPPALLPPGTFGELRAPGGNILRRRTFSYDGSATSTPPLPVRLPISRQVSSPRFFTVTSTGRSSTRFLAVAIPVGRDTGIVAVPLREADQTLHRLIVVEVLVGAGVILALVLLGWIVIRLELRPLERIGRVASEIAGGDLSRRVAPTDQRTEVGRLGLALNEMLGQIEEAFQDRSRSEKRLRGFLADASHELRTPLASIRGYAELFRMGAAEDPQTLRRAMSRIEAEAARMGVLVEDLLLLAQLDQDPGSRRVPVELGELTEHAVDDARVVASGRQIELTVAEPVTVLGDPDRLRQLLANLLRNAIIHTPPESPIEVSCRREGRRAQLEVRDYGPGLPAGAGDQVFERFWRTEGGRRRGPGGAGLGLAIVRAVVAGHGGEVLADNPSGGGARFRVWLRLAPPGSEISDRPPGSGVLSGETQDPPGRSPAGSPTVSAP